MSLFFEYALVLEGGTHVQSTTSNIQKAINAIENNLETEQKKALQTAMMALNKKNREKAEFNQALNQALKRGKMPTFFGLPKVSQEDQQRFWTEVGKIKKDTLRQFDIPRFITSIPESAFDECVKLKSVMIPDKSNLTSIGKWAFQGCIKLKSIVIPKSVTEIGESVFQGCIELKSIVIPESVTKIGDWAFAFCKKLESIMIPAEYNLTSIGKRAFQGCNNLIIPPHLKLLM